MIVTKLPGRKSWALCIEEGVPWTDEEGEQRFGGRIEVLAYFTSPEAKDRFLAMRPHYKQVIG
jgi:hypothetical protein